MKQLISAGLLLTMLSLTACNNIDIGGSNNNEYRPQLFEVDELTVRQNNEWNVKQEIAEENNETTVNTEEDIKVDVGEVQLENTDTSIDYTIEGGDIVYNGIRFVELSTAVNSVSSPYDTNTFINFIIKTYSTAESTVNVSYNIDSNTTSDSNADTGAYVGLHESLMADSSDYQHIYNKYGVEADWQLLLDSGKPEELGILYGCSTYVMYQGVGNLVIDMNEFDSGAPLENMDSETVQESEVTNE